MLKIQTMVNGAPDSGLHCNPEHLYV